MQVGLNPCQSEPMSMIEGGRGGRRGMGRGIQVCQPMAAQGEGGGDTACPLLIDYLLSECSIHLVLPLSLPPSPGLPPVWLPPVCWRSTSAATPSWPPFPLIPFLSLLRLSRGPFLLPPPLLLHFILRNGKISFHLSSNPPFVSPLLPPCPRFASRMAALEVDVSRNTRGAAGGRANSVRVKALER